MAKLEAILLVVIVIGIAGQAGNNAKALESGWRIYPLCFQAVIRLSGAQILVFFRAAAGPIDDHTVDLIA